MLSSMFTQLTTPPDYHFLLIAPNLGAEWLFDAARAYWIRFHPTVIGDLELPTLIPPQRPIAVTVIARRDSISEIGVLIAQRLPLATFDPVVFDTFEEMRTFLNDRAAANQPFGALMATLPPPIIPTARRPVGFVTATPTDDPGTLPDATPDVSPTQPPNLVPIEPTPGPITGG